MPYDIIGTIHNVGPVESVPTKTGGTLLKRTVILEQRRYDPNTGQQFTPNYPSLEFTNQGCAQLDTYTKGSRVKIRFDVQGSLYNDRQTGRQKSFTHLRGFRIEPYTPPQAPAQGAQVSGRPPQAAPRPAPAAPSPAPAPQGGDYAPF